MQTKIAITYRDVYGNELAYPANDQAKRLADLVGMKTLTPAVLRQAQDMGFEIVETDKRGNVLRTIDIAA